MIATILTDNTPRDDLMGEWGLSVYIQHRGHCYLLDTGESSLFLQNAHKLGLLMENVEAGVLSHAHYDHSDGMAAFFEENKTAPFYLRSAAKFKCYDRGGESPRYIGIRDGILDKYSERIIYLNRDFELHPGAHILGHHTPGLEKQGRRMNMYLKQENGWRADDFQHEQSFVLETDRGLAVFSSCSHAGADVILREVQARFPGKKIAAIIGGLHLYKSTPEEVRALARGMRETGVERVITGHCTGDEAMEILREELGEALESLYCGKIIEI